MSCEFEGSNSDGQGCPGLDFSALRHRNEKPLDHEKSWRRPPHRFVPPQNKPILMKRGLRWLLKILQLLEDLIVESDMDLEKSGGAVASEC